MANKRYVYRVLYENKVIDKIKVTANDEDTATEKAYDIALNKLQVEEG